jgi:hypothetical protein
MQIITIEDSEWERYPSRADFIQQYIFPGGQLPAPQVLDRLAAHSALDVGKIDTFGLDYARTLEQLRIRFESSWPQLEAAHGLDERFRRMWQLHLTLCEAGFRMGRINVEQWGFSRGSAAQARSPGDRAGPRRRHPKCTLVPKSDVSLLETASWEKPVAIKMSDMTGLGRPVDTRIPSNRLAVSGTIAAGMIIAGKEWIASGAVDVMTSLTGAVAVFLAWAIGRELDPDNPSSAGLAMAVTLLFGLFTGIEAAGAAVTLLGLRVLVGSVGRLLKPTDHVVLILAAGYAGSRPELWPSAALIVFALVIDRSPGFRLASAAALATASATAMLWSPGITWDDSVPALAGVVFAVLASLASIPGSKVRSKTDGGTEIISSSRVALARMAAGGTIAAATLISPASFPAVAPVLASLASVALVAAFSDGRPRFERRSTRLGGRAAVAGPGSRS